jgi:hypothetical protein
VEGRLVRDALDGFVRRDAAVVLAPREVPEALARLAEARVEVAALPAKEVGEGADAGGFERGLSDLAHAPDEADGAVAEKGGRIGPSDDREAARLVEVRGDLGEELVVREPDRAGDAELLLHPAGEAGEHDGGRRVMEALRAPRSRKASSRERGSTMGVRSSIIARTCRETSTYRSIRPFTTTASGQSFSAWNIGMAERTPLIRAM